MCPNPYHAFSFIYFLGSLKNRMYWRLASNPNLRQDKQINTLIILGKVNSDSNPMQDILIRTILTIP